jgi:uncharacterized protein YbaA (DUF1428 family)
MSYIEAFILAVPAARKEKYRQHAENAWPFFQKHGATRMVECWGDDVPEGKVTDFRRAVKSKGDETVVFSWIEYPDKRTRDASSEAIQADPAAMPKAVYMPFDAQRMIYSGFMPILEHGSSEGRGYVDGFVIPVENTKRSDYLTVAKATAPLFIEHGATQVVETIGDDMMKGKLTDFFRAVDAKSDETVVFSWIAWPSREARDKGNAAAMADDRFKEGSPEGTPGSMPMPFDGKRLIMGGFVPIVDERA